MLNLQQISHRYSHWVLKDASAELKAGQRCLLTGANGSGKTTLLKICAGLLTPTSGKRKLAKAAIVQCALTASFLYNELSVAENLRFYAALQGHGAHAIDWAVNTWGLRSFFNQSVATLSLGQTQRASLARATLVKPDVLLLDEPSTGLDAEGLGLLESYLQSFDGLAIVATHDPASFESLSNCLMRLHDDHRLELR